MTTLREATKRALENLDMYGEYTKNATIRELCKVLAEQIVHSDYQEPVAWLGFNPRTGAPELSNHMPAPSVIRDFKMRPLVYGDTSISPQRKPLTDEEISSLISTSPPSFAVEIVRIIERAHGIGSEE